MISKRIRDLCNVNKITLKNLAEKCDISQHGLNKMLHVNDFKTSTLEKIARVLKVPVGYFFDELPDHEIGNKNCKRCEELKRELELCYKYTAELEEKLGKTQVKRAG